MEQITKSKVMNMRRSISDTQCPVCRGRNYEIFQAWELAKIDAEKYKDTIQSHINTYSSLEFESQGYPIPCRGCNGGHDARVQAVKSRADIPVSFYDKKLNDFDWTIYKDEKGNVLDLTDKKNAAESFLNQFNEWEKNGMGLYIFSNMKGSGKTFLASCLCNSLIEKYPISTKFISSAQLIDLSKQSDGSGNYESDPIALLCNARILCIDDIGQQNSGLNWYLDILYRILDSRYQKKLVTICTSNISMQRIASVLDDRCASRIDRMCFQLSLPDWNVRNREGNEEKVQFLKNLGLM